MNELRDTSVSACSLLFILFWCDVLCVPLFKIQRLVILVCVIENVKPVAYLFFFTTGTMTEHFLKQILPLICVIFFIYNGQQNIG